MINLLKKVDFTLPNRIFNAFFNRHYKVNLINLSQNISNFEVGICSPKRVSIKIKKLDINKYINGIHL